MRRGAVVVICAVLALPASASAELQLHGAVTSGTGYAPIAAFDEAGRSPVFLQAEAGVLFDPIQRLTHGFSLSVPVGLNDAVVSVMPSYLLFRRPNLAHAQFLRVGYQLVVWPALANGVEVGAGFIYYLTAGLGLVIEADVDYFAGIDDSLIIGGQAGLALGYEVLP